jgi:hypothetical protein
MHSGILSAILSLQWLIPLTVCVFLFQWTRQPGHLLLRLAALGPRLRRFDSTIPEPRTLVLLGKAQETARCADRR